jgi:hypothetical protein
MDTNVATRDEQHQGAVGTHLWTAQGRGDEAGAMLGIPADPAYQIDTQPRRESGAWSWMECLEPLGQMLELLGSFGQ